MIITVGFLLGDATKTAAEANPDIKFSIVDYAYDPVDPERARPGLSPPTRRAFLAGYLAAGVSKTGIVGTFGGINIPPVTIFMDGFFYGVQHYNKAEGHERPGARLGSGQEGRPLHQQLRHRSTTAAPSPRTSTTKAPTSSCRSPARSASARRRSPPSSAPTRSRSSASTSTST